MFINLLNSDVHSALKDKIISTIDFQVSETLLKCAKNAFLNYCSHKLIKFLTQNI